MRLLTHNVLSSNIKGVSNGFPLRIEVEKLLEKRVDFNADFLRNMFPKIEWKAFVDAARTIGYAELPEEVDESYMLTSEEFLNKFHHALLELHLEEGRLFVLRPVADSLSIRVFPTCSFMRMKSESYLS